MCFLAGLLPFITVLVTHTRYSGSVNPLRTILKSRRVTTLERENFLKFTLSLQPSLHPHLSKVRWHHPGTSASPLRVRSNSTTSLSCQPSIFPGLLWGREQSLAALAFLWVQEGLRCPRTSLWLCHPSQAGFFPPFFNYKGIFQGYLSVDRS